LRLFYSLNLAIKRNWIPFYLDPIRKGLTNKKGTLKGFNFIARGFTPGY